MKTPKLFACDVRYYVAAHTKEEARLFAVRELEMECVRISPAHPNTSFDCSDAQDGSCAIPADSLVADRINSGEKLPLLYGWNPIPPWDAAKLKTGEVQA